MGLTLELHDVHFESRTTHNLVPMARLAGLYEVMWGSEDELRYDTADKCIEPLKRGIKYMEGHEDECDKLTPENGFGSYELLLFRARTFLEACEDNPNCTVVRQS
jgi:hypothetical protein